MKVKVFAIIAICLSLLICVGFVFGPLFFDNDDISAYSPVGMNPPPAAVSDPQANSKPENLDSYKLAVEEIIANLSNLKTSFVKDVNKDYIDRICEKFGSDSVETLANALADGEVDNKKLHSLLG